MWIEQRQRLNNGSESDESVGSPSSVGSSPCHPFSGTSFPHSPHCSAAPVPQVKVSTCCCHLLSYDETPVYLRQAYVLHGYRAEGHQWAALAPTLFHLHNETWNIWTHLVGFVVALGLLVELLYCSCPAHPAGKLPMVLFLLGVCLVMACSAIFHWFDCVNQEVHTCLRGLDWAAIPVLIAASGLAGVSYGFPATHQASRDAFLALITILGLLVSVGPSVPVFRGLRFSWVRQVAFVVLAICSGALLLGYLWLTDGPMAGGQAQALSRLLPLAGWYALSVGCYAVGVAFYVTRIPERWLPAEFYHRWHAGYSHNFFHAAVFGGSLATYALLKELCALPL